MSSSKREREYERRRYEKWQQRQVAHRERRRKQVIAASLVGVLVLGLGVVSAEILTRDDTAGSPTPTTGATATTVATGVVAQDFDPFTGDGEDHAHVANAVDGQPNTFWSTETYVNFTATRRAWD